MAEPAAPHAADGRVCSMLRHLQRHCTVPSDDANYDPPKFAGWRGRPKVASLYGMSCLLFLPVGVLQIYLARRCEAAGHATWQFPIVCSLPSLDGLLMIAVALTALHGDVIKLGSSSYWHVADRLVVVWVFALAAVQLVGMFCVGIVPFVLGITLAAQPLRVYSKSYGAREWDKYEIWHVLWHVYAATNKALGCALVYATRPDDTIVSMDGPSVPAKFLLVATAAVMAAEVLLFQAVEQVVDAWPGEKASVSAQPFVGPPTASRSRSPRLRPGGPSK